MDWYKFTPVDTLFFRGAEPMNLGENHTVSHVFPPPAHTLAGALRTAVLIQNGVSFKSYGIGNVPAEIIAAIGRAGQLAPFNLIGPLFMLGKNVYVPAPYSWFMGKDSNKRKKNEKIKVVKGKLLKSRLLKSEAPELIWAKGDESEMVSLGGMWIKKQDIYSAEMMVEVKPSVEFFENEPRTGIALEKNRRVREGHLYSFNHARLKRNVSLIFGTDSKLPLEDKGVLKIGAEQRFGWYEKLDNNNTDMRFSDDGNLYLSLSNLEGTEEANAWVVATGKILYFGGWDLHTGFHKPMKGYFPAGTVFNKKINNNCITIKGVETC
jgi:CRISPR-associated protein Cmr3